MNDRLSAKLRMYGQVEVVCGKYQDVWQGNIAFARAVAKLLDAKKGIDKVNKALQNDFSGATEGKYAEKLVMAKCVELVAGMLQAYAKEQKMADLIVDSDVSRDEIMKAKEVDADDMALYILDLAVEHFAALVEYGLLQEDLDELQKSVDNFTGKIGKPRGNANERKNLHTEQKVYFQEADHALQHVLDNLIHRYETKHKLFYDAYETARSVIRDGGRVKVNPETKQAKAEMAA